MVRYLQCFVSFTDIAAIRSKDAGKSWSFDFTGLSLDDCYQTEINPVNGRIYVATASIHDLYQSTYLEDSMIDGASGAVMYSDDKGATWQTLHNFKHAVVGLALDPNNNNRLYASVVHSTAGGVYVSSDIQNGSSSTWTQLADPPRTEGHPFSVHVLNDGALVCSYSGRISGSSFTASSGVFISTDSGVSWLDRSNPGMYYWTKDLVIDPHDTAQNTWYAAVFDGWGGKSNNLGGLYKTTDRGVFWTRILDLRRVESCTVSPTDPNEIYVTTETQGLWRSSSSSAGNPTALSFSLVSDYPFSHPMRVFYNPYDTSEVWATSFGNGLRVLSAPVFIYVNNKDDSCGGKTPCYSSIQTAINAAGTGTAIRIGQGTYSEAITLSTSKSLTFQGGWNSLFTTQSSTSTVNSMTIGDGSVIVDKLVIQ